MQSSTHEFAQLYKGVITAPADGNLWANIGARCLASNFQTQAITCFARAAAARFSEAVFFSNFGIALTQHAMHDTAVIAFEKSISLDPLRADPYFLMAGCRANIKPKQTIFFLKRATILNSADFEAQFQLGVTHALAGELNAATIHLTQSICLSPSDSSAYINLSAIAGKQNAYRQMLVSATRANTLDPHSVEAKQNIGVANTKLGGTLEGFGWLTKALAVQPNRYELAHNLADLKESINEIDQAISWQNIACTLAPTIPALRTQLGTLLLKGGHSAKGWLEYESRTDTNPFKTRNHAPDGLPRLRTTDALTGRRVLVLAEKGLGDSIQFIRFVEHLKKLSCDVQLRIQDPLLELVKRQQLNGIEIISEQDPIFADYYCWLMSLPHQLLERTGHLDHWQGAYIRSIKDQRSSQSTVGILDRKTIGLMWRGTPDPSHDSRSIDLELLLAHLPNHLHYVSLQRELTDTERQILRRDGRVTIPNAVLPLNFPETAEVIENCRLIVSVDTSIAHLAGSMGKPLSLLLKHNADWRWGAYPTQETPWYPQARLLRQASPGNWQAVLTTLNQSLHQL